MVGYKRFSSDVHNIRWLPGVFQRGDVWRQRRTHDGRGSRKGELHSSTFAFLFLPYQIVRISASVGPFPAYGGAKMVTTHNFCCRINKSGALQTRTEGPTPTASLGKDSFEAFDKDKILEKIPKLDNSSEEKLNDFKDKILQLIL